MITILTIVGGLLLLWAPHEGKAGQAMRWAGALTLAIVAIWAGWNE